MIPQNNPLANYLSLKDEIDAAVQKVLNSGWYILGEETAAFEREFAAFLGARFAVGVANGTEAICLALHACGIGPGDEVITVSHTAVATVTAIEMSGAVPLLAEIDPATYTLDWTTLDTMMTDRVRAVVPVHLYGHPAELSPLLEFAGRNNIRVIEDCAQSHGAAIGEKRTGTWGDAGAFSFYPTKNLGCLGDGGAVVTDDALIHERLVAARQYGWDHDRISRDKGFNSRLDEVQAAVLRVKLRRLDENNRRRAQIAAFYEETLRHLPLTSPIVAPARTHVYHQYVIRLSDRVTRDRLLTFLKEGEIQTAIHYPVPVHLQSFYSDRYGRPCSLGKTEEVCDTILSLPMYPELTSSEVERICARIHQFFERAR